MSVTTAPHTVESASRGKIAIWWFLASEIMLFGGLITSFVLARLGGGPAATHEHLNVTVAAVNTFVLLTSSYTMVEAFAAAEHGNRPGMRVFLALTVLAGLAFLGLKAYEYSGEVAHGFTPASGGFWSFYYTMTGLHALHVLVGVIANLLLLVFAHASVRRPYRVELAGLYWHFVDIVWIFLFPLLYLT
jgi:heme/copper-type cytochrome/quinol oxidase subunit 3